MSTHQEQAELLAARAESGVWSVSQIAYEIEAALDAAARTALEEAADELDKIDRWGQEDANWLRARAASLGEQK